MIDIKRLSVVAALILTLALVACGTAPEPAQQTGADQAATAAIPVPPDAPEAPEAPEDPAKAGACRRPS